MEYLDIVLKRVLPLAGVFLGWFFAIRTERYKNVIYENRKIKRTLFLLLEFRTELVKLFYISRIIELCTQRDNEIIREYELDEDDIKELKKKIEDSKKNTLTEEFISNIKLKINDSLNYLSEIDPVLAFKISGVEDIPKRINSFESEISKFLSTGEFEFSEVALKSIVLNAYVLAIDEIIEIVAIKTGGKQIDSLKPHIHIKTDKELINEIRDGVDVSIQLVERITQ